MHGLNLVVYGKVLDEHRCIAGGQTRVSCGREGTDEVERVVVSVHVDLRPAVDHGVDEHRLSGRELSDIASSVDGVPDGDRVPERLDADGRVSDVQERGSRGLTLVTASVDRSADVPCGYDHVCGRIGFGGLGVYGALGRGVVSQTASGIDRTQDGSAGHGEVPLALDGYHSGGSETSRERVASDGSAGYRHIGVADGHTVCASSEYVTGNLSALYDRFRIPEDGVVLLDSQTSAEHVTEDPSSGDRCDGIGCGDTPCASSVDGPADGTADHVGVGGTGNGVDIHSSESPSVDATGDVSAVDGGGGIAGDYAVSGTSVHRSCDVSAVDDGE